MELIRYPERKAWPQLLSRPVIDHTELETSVGAILKNVKQNGDSALREYAQRFDGAVPDDFLVTEQEFDAAEKQVPQALKEAVLQAKSNIEKFHLSQKDEVKVVETTPGVRCWRRSIPIERVGLYIPGGSAPLFSTVLMLGVPALLAGCREIVLCTPPSPVGEGKGGGFEAVLYTAKLVGISKVYTVGGAQAIAAMAYGTESVPAVNKIFGPGNQYVTCAKQLVSKDGVAIDMPAGPSEVAVLADDSCVPSYVAADLLSQAEHGPDSQVLLVSDQEKVIEAIMSELPAQLALLPRKAIAAQALANSQALLVKDKQEAMDLLNAYAPEHLIIACKGYDQLAERVINAGSVFLGNYSPESAGDYASGTNHTLPTNGYAKAFSGVSLDSFVKKVTFQELSEQGLRNIASTVQCMAEAEGLKAHSMAVTVRLKK